MKTPQIIIIILWSLGLLIHLAKHGEEKVNKFNFYGQFLRVCTTFTLLNWGGFFD